MDPSRDHGIVAGIPDLFLRAPVRDMVDLYTQPHLFGHEWGHNPSAHTSAWEILVWVVGIVTLFFGLYKVLAGSPMKSLTGGVPNHHPAQNSSQTDAKEQPAFRPRVIGFSVLQHEVYRSLGPGQPRVSRGTSIRTGVGVEFPEHRSKSPQDPQLMLIQMGMVKAGFVIIPAKFKARLLQTAGVLWLALCAAVFLHPIARLLGGHASFTRSLGLAIVVISYALLVFAVVTLVLAIIGIRRYRKGTATFLGCTVSTILLIGLGLVFVEVFAGLYGLSFAWSILAWIGALIAGSIASFVTTPIVFTPLVVLLLRFQDLLDVLLP
jgi:hypothetical protein